ncbi:hypothetical protein [Chryseobacterium sp. MA9]|uniref:hypothetical protein n=1 Tax=Chryseobacterium sp. MA9 TaxID=2966625 RepID=UPI002106D36D|nr:hypothetical protein [Chryseobacterium sp. MA9]UTX50979.1 hypothetical protein KIK00_00970 [Chryseobacterium sp. MA9]
MSTKVKLPVTAASGQLCPVSGVWKNKGTFTTIITISEKTTMPEYCGVKVVWILLYQY